MEFERGRAPAHHTRGRSSIFSDKWKGLIVAVLYGVFSISITFFNKAVFAVYQFDASSTLTLGQIVFSLLFLYFMRKGKLLDYEDFNIATAKSLAPLAGYFVGMVITGLAALRYVNVPMYSALRRLTTFIVIIGQYFLLNKTVPMDELVSVVLMVLGAFIAGWGDLSFDLYGYFLTALNCVVTAIYLVYIAKKSQQTGMETFGLMYYNNVMSLPIVVLIVMLTEYDALISFTKWGDIGFQMCFLMSSIQAFLLNYFMFVCSTVNSPLTTSITGQMKSILQTVFGFFTFGGVVFTPSLAAGLTMSTIGGVWYGVVKYQEQMKKNHKRSNSETQIEEGTAASPTQSAVEGDELHDSKDTSGSLNIKLEPKYQSVTV